MHHVLCTTTTSSTGISTGPLMGGASLPASLPHQISQLCSGQNPLLALQQNFSHLLPYANTRTATPPDHPPHLAQLIQHQSTNQPSSEVEALQRLYNSRNHTNNITGNTNNNQRHHLHHHHHHRNHHNHRHHESSFQHNPSHLNWRKSKPKQAHNNGREMSNQITSPIGSPLSLLDLSAKVVAEHIPFQIIEHKYEHIPEPVQRRIIFWSFPRHEDDIKMYSSLSVDSALPSSSINTHVGNNSTQSPSSNTNSNGIASSATSGYHWVDNPNSSTMLKNNQLTYYKGVRLYDDGCVQNALQVGFNLSGVVTIKTPPNTPVPSNPRLRNTGGNVNAPNGVINQAQNDVAAQSDTHNGDNQHTKSYRVSVTFDRCKITSVSCSCDLQDIFWCEHVVALILHRIRNPEIIDLRVPISETLLSLNRQQLQKLVQYIIAEHHTEVLPTAQRLLDEMRQSFSEINQIHGAPDPTAGASAGDQHIWHLDEQQVNEKVQNYLNLIYGSSRDAAKQIHALFEKIREMFKARDSNGIRLLKLITEQFLVHATRNEKPRPLWDQLVSLWVVVMLNPDLEDCKKDDIVELLINWSKVPKCPKEDIERRVSLKRKAADLSDDDDNDELSHESFCSEYLSSFNQSNNYPAHMATHRHRAFQPNFPAPRLYNQVAMIPSTCPCQMSHSATKKIRTHMHQPASSSSGHHVPSRGGHPQNSNENRHPPQEPRSVFYRALDVKEISWDEQHLQLILNKDGPIDLDRPSKSSMFDFTGNPLWNETISQASARIETLKSHGYQEQALRLAVATVRRLKLQQDQWCVAATSDSNFEPPCSFKGSENYMEGWIGHPMDPINILVDVLLDASLTESNSNNNGVAASVMSPCTANLSRCSCPYNQALADLTHRLLPDLANFSYSALPLVNLAPRRPPIPPNPDKTPYFHVSVPGCCQRDTYLTLAVEVALIALGQQRLIPTIQTAHERAVRQEATLLTKLESIDTNDPLLVDILKHQATLLLEGGPFHNSCCGIPADSAPLHTFARYLFDSLFPHYPQLAYKVGLYALKMPLLSDENGENIGAARTSPRSINHNHLQNEQLSLAQTMLSKAKDEGSCLRKVFRASIKNIKNSASLLKLSKHLLKEAKPNGPTLYPALLRTSFDLGLQVLKMTNPAHASSGKTRREAILFIVECATDIGLDTVIQLIRETRDFFSPVEALNLVVSRDNDHVNLRSQAISKLKLKDNPRKEEELNSECRELALESAGRDPTNCALEALKFCETDDISLKKALKIITEAGKLGTIDSTQLIKVADHIHERGMTDKAFDMAMVAVDSLSITSNSDNSSAKKDIFSACEYAQKVSGFSTLIPKLINNIECATVLSEIYHRFCPGPQLHTNPAYRNYGPDAIYRGNFPYNKDYADLLNPEALYRQRLDDAQWWDALLNRTLKAFIDTTRSRLQNISPRHYSEFIDFLTKAKGIFEKATDGPQQFKDLISEMMKSYKTKKKLMEKLKASFGYSIKTG